MNVTLFGATGLTGVLVTKKVLEAGHDVKLFARNPEKLGFQHERLSVIQGKLTDQTAISRAIAGSDAVISVLGPTTKSKGRPVQVGMDHIVKTMVQHGVRRLIATSTISVIDPADNFVLSFWLAAKMIKTLQRDAYEDVVESARLIRASNLDWTLVRLPMLTNKESASPLVADYAGSPGIRLFWLSRNVLADFLCLQLQDRSWIRKSPAVSNRV